MQRIVASGLGLLLGANALAMLIAPLAWYAAVPGVAAAGPFNPHFVADIGMAYLVVTGALAWFAWRPGQGWPALVAATAFLGLHGLVHLRDAAASPVCGHDLLRDLPGVFAPALIAAWIAVTTKPKDRSL
jgi:hypothetical protein